MSGAAVASSHPATTEAAAAVLRAGGNAFDAVVAAGFASAAAEPVLTSLGGGGFLLARTAAGDTTLFDFFVDTPGRGATGVGEPHFFPVTVDFGHSTQVFNVGLGSVAVPGNLAGYLTVQRRLGRLDLAEVLAPAIRLARKGVPIGARHAYLMSLVAPILLLEEAGRAIFAPSGRLLAEGERLVNRDLASFLERLPEAGEGEVYGGATAARIAADMCAGGGLLNEADLASYRVVERQPLEVDYRGHRVLTNPPPSFGGTLLALALRLLESQSFDEIAWGSAAHLDRLACVMREVDRLREEGLERCGGLETVASEFARRLATRGTTHVSVADAHGNVASMTTSNGEGSGYIVPGTGIMLNNMLGEEDLHPQGFHAVPAGERVGSMMSPTLVSRDGRWCLALGSGGSKRIRSALLQVISCVVDRGARLREAVEAPRLHWDGEQVQVEPGFDPAAVEGLRRGWTVNTWSEPNLYFGGVNAVAPDQAAADPRRGGSAAVLPA